VTTTHKILPFLFLFLQGFSCYFYALLLGLVICSCSHFVQVVNDILLLREDIDIDWLFVGKVDLEEELALHLILRRYKNNLVEFWYCRL
jgi:hypothetical protein